MRIWILGIVLVIALTIVGFFILQARDDRAWEEAQHIGTISAYETFLSNYPNSEYVQTAEKALALCREESRWEELYKSESVEAFKAFMDEFPQSSHFEEVRQRLKSLLLISTIERFLKKQKVSSTKSIDEILSIALSAEKERPNTLNDYRIAMDILSAFRANSEAETFRASFPRIKPEKGGESLQLGEYALSKSISMSGSISGGKSNLSFKGMIVPPDGRLSGAIALGEGTLLIIDPSIRFRNFSGNIAITSCDMEGAHTAFTELPDEWVFYRMGGFGIQDNQHESGILLPNGRGTLIRFKGLVRNYFEGFTIHGDEEYPLAFVLLDEAGLTYVCGKGSVTDPDGRKWLFPGKNLQSRIGE